MENLTESEVQLRQDFDVPVEKVYEAWTNPEQLKQWWRPMNNILKDVTNELRTGGTIDYVFEENKLQITGNYIKVEENRLLEYTWNWELPHDPIKNSSYTLNVQFENEGNRSHILITQDAIVNNEGVLPHHEGWKKALNDLRSYLSSSS